MPPMYGLIRPGIKSWDLFDKLLKEAHVCTPDQIWPSEKVISASLHSLIRERAKAIDRLEAQMVIPGI